MFKNAIVRRPAKSMINGITEANLGVPDYALACQQHDDYIKALQECGLEVLVLDANEDYPDSCFVEDPALFTRDCVVLTNPGAESRRGEVTIIEAAVRQFRDNVEHIETPGFLEGGDVMMIGDHFYVGLSDRTNPQGVEQLSTALNKYGFTCSSIELTEVLHLKTGVVYLENNILVASGEFLSKPEFQNYKIIEVPAEEAYAANCIWINDTVLVPASFPIMSQQIKDCGYQVREVAMSEFEKLDGGLSCLSLRF